VAGEEASALSSLKVGVADAEDQETSEGETGKIERSSSKVIGVRRNGRRVSLPTVKPAKKMTGKDRKK